jgi:hypothetical protein
MSQQTEEARRLMAVYAGQIGGAVSSKKNEQNKKGFFDASWQKEFGFKDAGKRNVKTGFLANLNRQITEKNPELRKKAGKLGGKARVQKQKQNYTGLFDLKKRVQRKANLVRWGIVINGTRVPFKKLSSDFANYFIEYGNPFYKN